MAAIAITLLLAIPAHAVQHLVNPGDDWGLLGPRLRPGDEIILMPGTHRGASFDAIIGTPQKPITIRSADPQKPSTIAATREAIRIRSVANIIITNIIITGGSISGISLGEGAPEAKSTSKPVKPPASQPAPQPASPAPATPASDPGQIQIRKVNISKVGSRGQRHALAFYGLSNVHIDSCEFNGWSGSAIEMVACRDSSIDHCKLTGSKDFTQLTGIRLRGGCERIQVQNCRLENAGERGISIGGVSELADFVPPLKPDEPATTTPNTPAAPAAPASGSVFEAADVLVERCLVTGSACAIAFIHADDCVARNNTIMHPKRSIFGLISEQTDPRFTPGNRNIFGMNIAVWDPGELKRIADINPKAGVDSFILETNLWWSSETPEQRAKLPIPTVKNASMQVTDLDPRLNAAFKPGEPQAQAYGF